MVESQSAAQRSLRRRRLQSARSLSLVRIDDGREQRQPATARSIPLTNARDDDVVLMETGGGLFTREQRPQGSPASMQGRRTEPLAAERGRCPAYAHHTRPRE